jgi:hypothetical protein
LVFVEHGYSHLWGIGLSGGDVSTDPSTVAIDQSTPCDMSVLVDIRQVVEFMGAQASDSHPKSGVPTPYRQLIETPFDPMPIVAIKWAEDGLGSIRKVDSGPRPVGV